MSVSKKQLVLDAIDQKNVERVPSGFWFHFLKDEIHSNAFEHPELNDDVFKGISAYIEGAKPDFVKIMTDGYFPYENESVVGVTDLNTLKNVKPLPDNAKWFTDQIAYAKKVTSKYGHDLATFYNLFVPGTILKFNQTGDGDAYLYSLIKEDKEAFKHVLNVIAHDVARLAKRLIKEAGVTGIYLSAQSLIAPGFTKEDYDEIFAPGEKEILRAANEESLYNILHICGYEGHRNDLTWFKDYEVKVINWAAVVEGVSLEEGQKIFGGRTSLGGFGNLSTDLLYKGTEDEIKAETRRLLKNAGRKGIILGADCTVPRDTDWKHFEWVREAAAE